MDPFLGQIIMFGGNFSPRGWAICEGQLLAISQNTALFSILGTTYGGDGRTTFGLPDLRGRVAVGEGSGPGLPAVRLGQKGGRSSYSLISGNIPPLNVTIPVSEDDAAVDDPNGAYPAVGQFYSASPSGGSLKGGTTVGGNSEPIDNHQPFQSVNYIICLQGTFPSRN